MNAHSRCRFVPSIVLSLFTCCPSYLFDCTVVLVAELLLLTENEWQQVYCCNPSLTLVAIVLRNQALLHPLCLPYSASHAYLHSPIYPLCCRPLSINKLLIEVVTIGRELNFFIMCGSTERGAVIMLTWTNTQATAGLAYVACWSSGVLRFCRAISCIQGSEVGVRGTTCLVLYTYSKLVRIRDKKYASEQTGATWT